MSVPRDDDGDTTMTDWLMAEAPVVSKKEKIRFMYYVQRQSYNND